MPDAMLRVVDAVYHYGDDEGKNAVDHVNLTVAPGEFVAVLGRNGSGKSTLAKMINALEKPSSGEIWVNGIAAHDESNRYEVRRLCGMVFQNPDNQIVATIVEEDCAFGLENLGVAPEEIRRRVRQALAQVGMEAYHDKAPHMLSGGQKQRVAIAGVLAMRPKMIVFDESTAMLDPVGRRDVMRVARRLNREEGVTVLWITHFMDEAAQADRLVVMDKGKIACTGAPREVFADVEQVRALGLEVPEMTYLASELRREGVDVPENVLTVEELTEAVCRKYAPPVRVDVRRDDAPQTAASAIAEETACSRRAQIEVKGLSYTYMPGTPFEKLALNDVRLRIDEGEFVGIIGHTGSGKSTLITHFNALIRPAPGKVLVGGKDLGDKSVSLTEIRRTVGLVFQYPEYQLFEETVAKDVAFGPRNLHLPEEEIQARVNEAIAMVGLPEDVKEASPFDLSGGQKRRVAIAGVLAMRPSILVLDEPAAGLDPAGRREMLELIQSIHLAGETVVMVSHSMEDVGRLCDRLMVLSDGEIVLSGSPAEVFSHGDELSKIGLDVPQCARLADELREKGFDMPHGVFGTQDVKRAIVEALKGAR